MRNRSTFHIAFFGSSLISSYWNGAATYYRGMIKALADRGHQITFYEPDVLDRQQHRDIPDPPWARVVVYQPDLHSARQALLEAQRADILIKASGVGIFDEWLEREILEPQGEASGFGKQKALKIFWDVDAPATLERVNNNPQDPFRPLVPRYDFILTYGGGQPVIDAYEALGARLCEPVYNAVDPEAHYPVPGDPRFSADLGFLGNRLPDRELRVHEFFFKAVANLSKRQFLLGGNGWDGLAGCFKNLNYAGHIYTRDHNAFNCSPLAVLNIARDSMARTGYSPATRVFEAAGAGACIISDAWSGMEDFLTPGKEVLIASSGEEVIQQLQSLTPEKAKAIGDAARKRVLSQHTYRHRALQFESLMQMSQPARTSA